MAGKPQPATLICFVSFLGSIINTLFLTNWTFDSLHLQMEPNAFHMHQDAENKTKRKLRRTASSKIGAVEE